MNAQLPVMAEPNEESKGTAMAENCRRGYFGIYLIYIDRITAHSPLLKIFGLCTHPFSYYVDATPPAISIHRPQALYTGCIECVYEFILGALSAYCLCSAQSQAEDQISHTPVHLCRCKATNLATYDPFNSSIKSLAKSLSSLTMCSL
jgi:hypothetical protein